ncbi:MAG: GFA family protein [Hyphomicrobiaceae bacterium]|nr:GFA family protein [Hyphomicrobiaceae bacterium]
MTASITGGCQCGAIRYKLTAEPQNAHICHCRMCQKAFGNYFAALARVELRDVVWTRGTPAIFKSSSVVERGFCRDCGTPLTFRYTNKDRINIALGTLDDPKAVPPVRQYGIEGQMPFFADLHSLPGTVTENDIPESERQKLRSLQHPDHDVGE